MKNDRRLWLKGLAVLPMVAVLPAQADAFDDIRQKGRLRIAVYEDFPPYSMAGGKGIDADIGRAVAAKLGLTAEIVAFGADEDMNDDLRNMVWKGHYLGTQPADVMLHVPVDENLARNNDKVRIFGPYHRETVALARNPARIQALSGSAAVALEVFTREKIGVETESLADSFLLSVLNGRLRDNVVHFRTVAEAARGLREGRVSAVLATRAELEAALAGGEGFPVEVPQLAELKINGWPLGMAVKAEEITLAKAVDGALGELKADGTLASIFKKYGVTFNPA